MTYLYKRYEKWKDIATESGPAGLRLIKGFHDEALDPAGHRSAKTRDRLPVGTIYGGKRTLQNGDGETNADKSFPGSVT